MQRIILCVLTVMVLLSLGCPSCGRQVASGLNMQNPDPVRTRETVVIKIIDDAGKPVSGARIYSPEYLGDTAKDGSLVTFFKEPDDYELVARKGEAGEPGFAEAKGRISVIPGPVELQAYDGVPPLLPPGQVFAGELAYKPGMMVRFGLRNVSNEVIVLYSPAPWKIQSWKGETVFEPGGVPSVIKVPPVINLAPGESKEWSWNQQDNDGQQVGEGGYIVVLRCSKGEYGLRFWIIPARMMP